VCYNHFYHLGMQIHFVPLRGLKQLLQQSCLCFLGRCWVRGMSWTQFQISVCRDQVRGGYLAVSACAGQKVSQSTPKAYRDGWLRWGGLLDMLQLPFLLPHAWWAFWMSGQEAGKWESLEFGSGLCVLAWREWYTESQNVRGWKWPLWVI